MSAKLVAIALLAGVTGCSAIEAPSPLVNLEPEVPEPKNEYLGIVEKFLNSASISKSSPNPSIPATVSPSRHLTFFLDGAHLISVRCDLYFTRLGDTQQGLDFATRELALLGGLTSALLGLAGAGATTVAITGAAFGFATATADNFRTSYLFGPDIASVHVLVKHSRNEFLQTVQSKGVGSFSHAVSLLRSFEQLCEPQEIKRLVNASVETAEPQSGQAPSPLLAVVRPAVAGVIGKQTLTDDELFYIYWATSIMPGSNSSIDMAIDTALSSSGLTVQSLNANKGNQQQLVAIFAGAPSLVSQYDQRIIAETAQIQGVRAGVVGPGAPTSPAYDVTITIR